MSSPPEVMSVISPNHSTLGENTTPATIDSSPAAFQEQMVSSLNKLVISQKGITPVCFTPPTTTTSGSNEELSKGEPFKKEDSNTNTSMSNKNPQKSAAVAPLSCCADTYSPLCTALVPLIMNTPAVYNVEHIEEDDSPVTEQRNVTVARVIKRNKKDTNALVDASVIAGALSPDTVKKNLTVTCDGANAVDGPVDTSETSNDNNNSNCRIGDNTQDAEWVKEKNIATEAFEFGRPEEHDNRKKCDSLEKEESISYVIDKEELYKEARNRIFTPVSDDSNVTKEDDEEKISVEKGKPTRKFRGVVDAHEHSDYARGWKPPLPTNNGVHNNYNCGSNLIPSRNVPTGSNHSMRISPNYVGYNNHNSVFGGDNINSTNGPNVCRAQSGERYGPVQDVSSSNTIDMINVSPLYTQRGRGSVYAPRAAYETDMGSSVPLQPPQTNQPLWGQGQLPMTNSRGNYRGHSEQYRRWQGSNNYNGPHPLQDQQQRHNNNNNRGTTRGRGCSNSRGLTVNHTSSPYPTDGSIRPPCPLPNQYSSSVPNCAIPIDTYTHYDEGCQYAYNSVPSSNIYNGPPWQPKCATSMNM